ncbi:hypothetical protein DYB32_001593 [Aphanomyces invadans]|uniref:CDP-alcohol phosphatidyltransferase n=1 Tax=Aphanomyces invadans TaxID=157072 RepID=A0A3R6W2C0_9STRA|nr:hypothetical protein DYB32_001593 [Aphanomyces invadans]
MAHHYVSARGAAQLPKYKYSGNDKSLLYNYFLSPLAQRIVDTFFPPWLAPNTITTGGLGLVALSHLILAYYAPTLDGVAPPAAYLFSAAALFWYQVLDVTDGKQARKTGNSSPLGLLFDHGCDAVNVVFSACTMTSTMLMGPSIWSLGLLLSPSCVFLFATWEEYYTGTLDLGLINGPNEGLAIMYIIYAITAMTGPAFWTQCLVNVFNVAQAVKPSEFVGALGRIAPFIAFLGASLAYGVYSPSNILASHPRLFLWTIGLISCKEPYWLVRKSFAVIVAIIGLFYAGLIPVALEEAAFFAVFALVVAVYAHMVFFVVVDMTTILKIKVFTVKEKQ